MAAPLASCDDRPAAPSEPRPAAIYAFLVGLIAPIGDLAAGHTQHLAAAIAALVAFVACFVGFVELRRRHRHLGLARALVAAMTAIAAATLVAFGGGWWALFMYVAPTVVSAVPLRWGPAAIAACVAGLAGLALVDHWPAAGAASVAMSIAMCGYVALLLRRRGLLITELRAAHGQVARLAAADAVIDERLRIARDLHDLLGHSLSVIALKSELARRLVAPSPDRAAAEVADIEQIARRALVEVREAVTGYRARSVQAELAQARAALEAAGVAVTTTVTAPALPAELDDLLAWIVREATTNVVRHSRARRADIELAEADGLARLEIRNDGAAPGTEPGGHGLAGLRERIAEAGGQLTARLDGAQFQVIAIVPLTPGASA
ncbi:MAG TPA: sensor histidine kinase [Kofleriaceae bacterium]